jgi:flavin reductase (DIM6/NTAB) family NADH-FMN oxidoreductase RutF
VSSGTTPVQAASQALREVHRRFPTGVTVVTTQVDGQPHGLAVNAFASVSLDPPMVFVCVAASAATYAKLFVNDHIGISFLAEDQADVAARFARSGGDKFADLEWAAGAHGAPLIDGAAGHLELEVVHRIPVYTHTAFLGRVVMAAAYDREPLVYLAGSFFRGSTLVGVNGAPRG